MAKAKIVNGVSFFSKNTLRSWTKQELIEHISFLQQNYETQVQVNDQQYVNFNGLLNDGVKKLDELVNSIQKDHSDKGSQYDEGWKDCYNMFVQKLQGKAVVNAFSKK